MGMIKKIERKPDEDVIGYLEELIEMARSGNLTEIVIVGNLSDEGVHIRYSKYEDRWRMLGAIEYAKCAIATAEI